MPDKFTLNLMTSTMKQNMESSASRSTSGCSRHRVIGVGELLWDMLPSGPRMGGATANFVYHAAQLGADARLVTRVGADEQGMEITEKIRGLGLCADGIQTDAVKPTGTVGVVLAADGQPTYTIYEDVAWDHIKMTKEAEAMASSADVFYFGTLSQRSPGSRATIAALLECVSDETLRLLDVNLRQSFYSRERLQSSLGMANVLKINEGELEILAEMFGLGGTMEDQLFELVERHALRLAACTCGGEGSILCDGNRSHRHTGCRVTVKDTIGAGDSFAAAVAMGLLHNLELEEINDLANSVAAFVSSQEGGTPVLPPQFLAKLHTQAKEVYHA